MIPAGVTAVTDRIADIEARFRPAPGFHAALLHAQQATVASGDDAASGADDVTGVDGASIEAAGSPTGQAAPAWQGSGVASGAGPSSGVGSASGVGGAGPGWAQRLPQAGQPWALAIEQAARAAGVEPELLAAVVQAESGFRPDARSHAGAVGLAQLMPSTAAALGVDPHDPVQNLHGGARYLRAQLDAFGAVDLALAAYNAGPHRVAQAGGIPQIAETQGFVENVRANYVRLR